MIPVSQEKRTLMSELGVSPKRKKATPFGGGWGEVGRAFLGSSERATSGSKAATLPNTRMQRTRSSASPPRSPLMRNPLGGLKSS